MGEVKRIEDQYRRSYQGEAWHGPGLLEILEGITAEKAAAHPIAGLHSIWEILGHVVAWQDVFERRLAGIAVNNLPEDQNFPPVADATQSAWQKMKETVERSCRRMQETISRLPEERLNDVVPGKSYTFYFMAHGTIQHNLYHAGQIAILRKA
jgi:uncharacterized damage-inducible protein DinB